MQTVILERLPSDLRIKASFLSSIVFVAILSSPEKGFAHTNADLQILSISYSPISSCKQNGDGTDPA
jgi:hypothetical protein